MPGDLLLFRLIGKKHEGADEELSQKLKSLYAGYPDVERADWSRSIFVNFIPGGLSTKSEHLLLPDRRLILVHQN